MKITLIQDFIYWADIDANLRKAQNQLEQLSGTTDLVVFPEMFTTGFCIDQLELAETMEGKTVQSLCDWAKQFNLALAGSFIASENGKYFNRGFIALPNGEIHTSDKRHLFSVGNENKLFTRGDKRLIVNYKNINICLLICYDVRFPVWSRNKDNEYDILIYVANFPERRIADWDALLKARAIENQAYVCGVNRIGEDAEKVKYNGHSVLLDYQGKTLLTFPENGLSIQTFEIEIDPLGKFRRNFPFWADAD